ncbi:MAG: hypothetical protein Q7V63_04970 [Gammaproteobacteria bacterium]|nr:hypothetical protein [Gammaproteobacteria bacterium]
MGFAIISGLTTLLMKAWSLNLNYNKETALQEKIAALLRLPPQSIRSSQSLDILTNTRKKMVALHLLPTGFQVASLVIIPILKFASQIDISNEDFRNPWPYVSIIIATLLLYHIFEPCLNRYGDMEVIELNNEYNKLSNDYLLKQVLVDPENTMVLLGSQVTEEIRTNRGDEVIPRLRTELASIPFTTAAITLSQNQNAPEVAPSHIDF